MMMLMMMMMMIVSVEQRLGWTEIVLQCMYISENLVLPTCPTPVSML